MDKKGCIEELNGSNRYYDKNGREITEGDFVRLEDGKVHMIYAWGSEYDSGLGTDATNPSWIKNRRATACQNGIYRLTLGDVRDGEIVFKKGEWVNVDYTSACNMVDGKTIFYFEDLKVGDFCKTYIDDLVFVAIEEVDVDEKKYGFLSANCINVETGELDRIGGDVPVLKLY